METIPKNLCEKVAFVKKTHGIHGEIVIEFETIFEMSLQNAKRFFIELEGLLVPFFVDEEGFRFRSTQTAIIKLMDVGNETYAKRLVGKPVYLFQTEITHFDEYLDISKFTGFNLIDTKHGNIGVILEVNDYSGNVVFTVDHYDNELLIPYNEDFVVDFNPELKRLQLELPDGIIDLD